MPSTQTHTDAPAAVRFSAATPEDDAAIRRLLRRTPMPGDVTVRYEREPSFFRSLQPMGAATQVVVGRPDDAPGRVVALGCRTIQRRFLGGKAQRVAYLSLLRVDPAYRGQGLVAQGFRTIRRWHEADPVACTYITITADNAAARHRLVEAPTGTIPACRPVADLRTLALVLRRWRWARPDGPAGITVTRGPSDLAAVAQFLRDEGRTRPLFPVYHAEDFTSPSMLDFDLADLFVARRGGQVVGTLGLWDVSGHKQAVVHGYRGALRWTRPAVNAALRLAGARPLPAPGTPLRSVYASIACAADDDPAVCTALLDRAYRATAATDAAFLIVGGAVGDPFLDAAASYGHIPYRSTLYTAQWTDAAHSVPLNAQRPHVDVATL